MSTAQSGMQASDNSHIENLKIIRANLIKLLINNQAHQNEDLKKQLIGELKRLSNQEIDDFLVLKWIVNNQNEKNRTGQATSQTFLKIAELKNIKNIAEAAVKAVKDERKLPENDQFRILNHMIGDDYSYQDEGVRTDHIIAFLRNLSKTERAKYFEVKSIFSKNGEEADPKDGMKFRDLAIYYNRPNIINKVNDALGENLELPPIRREWLKIALITITSIVGVSAAAYLLGRFIAPKQADAAFKTACNIVDRIPELGLKSLKALQSMAKPMVDYIFISKDAKISRGL
ncbi:hypothetical protein [Rickettsiales endosymbiont of Stachyamoeba lipophora]|uniref:hypothetical protein n=1 Tax=Rickettsiales endosymbiont of Stachyamoeba lipophora TaxID=2486578 RepID=UPI000F655D22|nr:hypothetical protein [Rickettsiales endosymbiont of Stachyamoeba lipophora]AZL14974.1 hypothetical protein EF513_00105 [Rickettsiales endosymbiont of Stachyamoeba lipophora]